MGVCLHVAWRDVLAQVSAFLGCCFTEEYRFEDSYGTRAWYRIDPKRVVAPKADLDALIAAGNTEREQHIRASILYALYARCHLEIPDIEYPTYQAWRDRHPGMTLDHRLPKKWFPLKTFDCRNWQPLSRQNNQSKGDDFLVEGLQELESLSTQIEQLKRRFS